MQGIPKSSSTKLIIATHLTESKDVYVGGSGVDTVLAHTGNDVVSGGDGNDSLYGQEGIDVLDGGNGDDRLYGGADGDYLIGGAGGDQLYGEDANDIIDGESGDDLLYGGSGNDTLKGGEGADLLDGGAGSDSLQGGNGDDTYYADIGDTIGGETASGGSDTVVIVAHDGMVYQLGDHLENVTLTSSGNPVWTLGNALNNQISGNDGGNLLFGLAGDDRLFGQAGNDFMDGGDGSDYLLGGAGGDDLAGQEGIDYLDGGDGNDLMDGGGGADTLVGGAGDDVFIFDLEDLGPAGGRWFGQAGLDSINAGVVASLDFTAIDDDRIGGIDVIILFGINTVDDHGANFLKIAASDIQAMSDSAVLRVDGTAEDQVSAVGIWSLGEPVKIGGQLYDTYSSADASLVVDADIAMTFV